MNFLLSFCRCRILKEIFLFHLVFISTSDCSSTSSCKPKERNVEGNEDVSVKSFKNLSGNALEEAVIDEILQRNKSNVEHQQRHVHLRHLAITRITKNMLRNFSDIHSIDLGSNLIDDIESGSFVANTKLEKIDLMGNRLVKITKHIFHGNFRELQEINLSFNAIVNIETGVFEKLVNLKSIDLSGNCIRHLHSDLFKRCEELREVNLHNNDISKVAFNLFSVKAHLKVLDLSHNHLDFIPAFESRSIGHYDMSFNNITHFDLNYESGGRRRGELARIETLTVAFNRISLCLELREMRDDIVHLDMSHNEIIELSHFPQLPNLEVLNLARNNISELIPYADDFDNKFPSLRVLNITLNDCADYRFMRSNFPRISLAIDANFTHHCSKILHDDNSDEMQQRSIDLKIANEIFRQLKLNNLLLIILLSGIVIIAVIHTTYVLYKHFRSVHVAMIKRGKLLIENIEL